MPLLLGGGLDQTYMPLHPFRKHSWLVLVVVQKSGRIPPVLVVSKQLPTLDQCESVAQFCGSSSSAMPSWSYQQQRGNGFPPHPRRGEKKRAKCNKGMLCFYKFDMFFFFLCCSRECILDFILDANERHKQSEMQETPTF